MSQLHGFLYETGKPSDWKPLKCTKQADGSYVLKVDTELSVDNLSLEINNIQVGSTDNTKDNTTYLKTKADGTIYIEGAVTITSSGTPIHYNGVANIAPTTVTFLGTSKHVQIEDMDGTKNIYVSFDGGTNWRTIQPGNILDVDCAITSLVIKASADGANYEILTVE